MLAMLLSLVAVPLYLQWLGQERYGLLLTGMAFGSYLMFADGGLTWASMLLIAEASGREDRVEIASIVKCSLSLAGCSTLLVAVIVTGLVMSLKLMSPVAWLPSHPEFSGLLIVLGLSTGLNLLFSPFYNLLFGLQDAHLATAYQGVGRLVGTLLMLVIARQGCSLAWIFAGNVFGGLLVSLAVAWHCRRRHSWAFSHGSFWNGAQIRRQLRMSVKSFIMQIGSILWGTAPVLAISGAAGPQAVPAYTVPVALLNAPFGLLTSFCANLQAGYGEAMGRGDREWITKTIAALLRKAALLIGLLGTGYMLLAEAFIGLWTHGHLQSDPLMLLSALVIVSMGTVLSFFRYALTGINRHRNAALADLICGLLCFVFVFLSVRFHGPGWVGAGVAVAVILSSGWMLPVELSRALQRRRIWPAWSFWARLVVVMLMSGIAGWLSMKSMVGDGILAWGRILVSGSVCFGVYSSLSFWLFSEDVMPIKAAIASYRKGLQAK